MKNIISYLFKMISITLLASLSYVNLFSQIYQTTNVCYEDLQTSETIKCDTSEHWTIFKNGDVIRLEHYIPPYKQTYYFGIQFRTEEKKSIVDGHSFLYSTYSGILSGGNDDLSLVVNWIKVDLNNDKKYESLKFEWIEESSNYKRVMYCFKVK
jgi:hypothetical protein